MCTIYRRSFIVAALLVSTVTTGRIHAAGAARTFAFEADKWFSLDDVKQGPITLHRIQVAHQKGLLTKSNLFRPGNADYLASIEIRIEYSNSATRDMKARLQIALLDEAGRDMDGYNGKEDLDSEQKYQLITIKLSTLKYALERAKQLRVAIDSEPD
jgi:hypothetical protein